MFKTETELQLELFPRNWTETETEIISGTEISLTKCYSLLQERVAGLSRLEKVKKKSFFHVAL